jgi:hypothetical protein
VPICLAGDEIPLKPESRLYGISVGHQGRPVSNGLQMLGVDIAVVATY